MTAPTDRDALTAAALALAARGWPVFPLRPGSKQPALHGVDDCPRTGDCVGRHRGWEVRASIDPDRIRASWVKAFNIGVACGRAGVVVVDLDTVKPDGKPPSPRWARLDITTGVQVLAELATEARESVPATFTVATPSGGRHLYFTAPPGVRLRNTAGEVGRGLGWLIDTRAHGGYVVGPGSITPAGAYRVVDDTAPAPLPAWLVARLLPPPPPPPPAPIRTGTGRAARYVDAAIEAETERVWRARTDRNFTLYCAANALGQLVAGGAVTEDRVRAALLDAAAGHIAMAAYSRRQAEATITSGLKAGARRRRTIKETA